MKRISKANLLIVWKKIDEIFDLFLPKSENGNTKFKNFQDEGEVDLKTLKTTVPLKNFVFPQSETFLKFKTKDKKIKFDITSVSEDEYVIFGARPCDIKSLEILDNIFLREPVDTYYKAHRDRAIIISLACKNPESSCFCGTFGIEPTSVNKATDISLIEAGDFYYWNTISEKGKKITELLKDILEEVSSEDLVTLKIEKDRIELEMENLPLNSLDIEKIDGELQEIFDKEKMWKELSRRCLACGSCTYVCPTCHCYDVKDYAGNNGGERFRCWDSCMFSDFTLMAHGNPRTEQMQRVRQRFMHKLVYYPNNHEGTYSCVGCGRCIEKCPVHIDIVKVIKKLVVDR
ncbi:4Fe-4S dicluster domain-containing protein [uncultured Cetobacterium sp.]|uniref:4Fe-4S dicluster domain-containing protein n=1 Tax=uncultured Cetobacterium sp. TaxID=527638 RepID=UPI002637A888|nr:4Fe-4S dicluster domain-containing protein [uncultured Cetobacterium sp.]